MTGPENSADAALEILRDWQWIWYDPDGKAWPQTKDLNFVVNTLALDGVLFPESAVLALLCRGDLIATGDFRWRKYQGDQLFLREGSTEQIKPRQWEQLSRAIDAAARDREANCFGPFAFDLPKLAIKDCNDFEWVFADNRFSTAQCWLYVKDSSPDYFEEWYSAWNIEIDRGWSDDSNEPQQTAASGPAVDPPKNQGGRPTSADWEAAALEMAGQYFKGDLKPTKIVDVSEALGVYLEANNKDPGPDAIKEHARKIFRAIEAWQKLD